MDLNQLITRLTIMKKNNPEEFNRFMNKLKIETPDVYSRVKLVLKEEKGSFSFGEDPLELRVFGIKKKDPKWVTIFIIVFVVVFFLVVIFLLNQ